MNKHVKIIGELNRAVGLSRLTVEVQAEDLLALLEDISSSVWECDALKKEIRELKEGLQPEKKAPSMTKGLWVGPLRDGRRYFFDIKKNENLALELHGKMWCAWRRPGDNNDDPDYDGDCLNEAEGDEKACLHLREENVQVYDSLP